MPIQWKIHKVRGKTHNVKNSIIGNSRFNSHCLVTE